LDPIIVILVIGSAIWVYYDAKKIGASRNKRGGFLAMGPPGWAICTLLLWILVFPLYLFQRPGIKAAAEGRSGRITSDEIPQSGVNRACKYIAIIWTLFCGFGLFSGIISLGDTSVNMTNDFDRSL